MSNFANIKAEWEKILSRLVPALDERFFAYGETCAAAIHYGGFFEEMQACEFAAVRADFQQVVPGLIRSAADLGLRVTVPKGTKRSADAPFVKVRLASAPNSAPFVYLYPLDNLPMQVMLRFRLLKEARTIAARAAKSGYNPEELAHLTRYNAFNLPLCACLANPVKSKHMGERTIFQRTVEKESLFPLRAMALGTVQVPVSANVSNWTLEITPERQQIINTVQAEELEALATLDATCRQLHLDYFLVGGSMLGALRHEGFIPWDDDTDVGFLRKDYKRFCRNCAEVLPEGYFLQLPKTDPHSHFVYARLRKAGYNYITHYNEDKEFNKGIWVDLFPFDARPKNESLARVQRKLANTFARAAMGFKRRREYIEHDLQLEGEAAPLASYDDARYLRHFGILARFFPIALCRGGYHFFARFFNPFLARRENAQFASFIPTYTTIAKNEVYPLRRVAYENKRLNIPKGAKQFLQRQYGEYTELPPVHERYSEHGFKRLEKID